MTARSSTPSPILLLRHAESRPDRSEAAADWPLSDQGRRQADQLITDLKLQLPDQLFSSPYLRARDTIAPFAAAAGLVVGVEAALRECTFRIGYSADWPAPIARAWADRSYAEEGCESAGNCQRRVLDCARALTRRCPGQRLLLCSHGNTIGLLLNSIDAAFGYAQWQAMTMPALYEVDLTRRDFRVIPLRF